VKQRSSYRRATNAQDQTSSHGNAKEVYTIKTANFTDIPTLVELSLDDGVGEDVDGLLGFEKELVEARRVGDMPVLLERRTYLAARLPQHPLVSREGHSASSEEAAEQNDGVLGHRRFCSCGLFSTNFKNKTST
jgi:hypothetical protein